MCMCEDCECSAEHELFNAPEPSCNGCGRTKDEARLAQGFGVTLCSACANEFIHVSNEQED